MAGCQVAVGLKSDPLNVYLGCFGSKMKKNKKFGQKTQVGILNRTTVF